MAEDPNGYVIRITVPKEAFGTLAHIRPSSPWLDEYDGSDRRTLAYNIAREVHWAWQRFPDGDSVLSLRLPVVAHTKRIARMFTVELKEALKKVRDDYSGDPPPLKMKVLKR